MVVYKTPLASAKVVVNTRTHEIYEATVHPESFNKMPIRWMNPKYKSTIYEYRELHHPDVDLEWAWLETLYHNIENSDEFLSAAGELFEAEGSSSVDLDLTDKEFNFLLKESVAKNITVRQLVSNIIEEQLKKEIQCHTQKD